MTRMDSARQAEEIFTEACELPPADRQRFVVHACGGNATLEREVQSLLPYIDDDESDDDHPTVDPLIGSHIDRYEIMSRLGEGGFGVVYLAEQSLPILRTVALKVIKRGMDTAAVVARFETERQALAVLDHPNVAGIFDAGSTDDGRPYFVMEHVQGVPISDYCNTEGLSVTERIKLVQAVCDAIQHAHNKGVIHRDIKPGNVLVSAEDGSPTVKVIDFGIAKALKGDSDASVTLTLAGVLVGTPDYMSPEQADGSHVDIDTRSDVYSIGSMLYELLAGVAPFAGKLQGSGLNELLRVICEDDPAKPSTRCLEEGRDVDTGGGRKQIMPRSRSFARKLRGDLDWIVMRCLEKDRERRYQTAADLSSDLGRYLSGQPVKASPASRAYRVKKLIRRNKAASTACAALVVAMVAGTVVSIVYARRASAAAAEAGKQRASALKSLEAEQAVVAFQQDYLTNLTQQEKFPWGRNRIADQLNNFASQLDSGPLDGSLAEARIRNTIAQLMLSIEKPDEAIRHLALAPEPDNSAEKELKIEHVKTLVLRAQALAAQERLDEAIAIVELASKILHDDPRLADVHGIKETVSTLQGRLLVLHGDLEHAKTHLASELQATIDQYGEDHELTIRAMREYSLSLTSSGLLSEGRELRKRADQLELHSAWATPGSIAISKCLLGADLMHLKLFNEASSYLVPCAEFLAAQQGPIHQMATPTYTFLGRCFLDTGNLDNAVEWMDRIQMPLPNTKQMMATAMTWGFLGGELCTAGRFEDAERQLANCLTTLRPLVSRYETVGSDFYLGALLGHSICLGKLGRYAEELAAMHEVLEIRSHRYGPGSPEVLKTQESIQMIQSRIDRGVRGVGL